MAQVTAEIPAQGSQPYYVGPVHSRVWLWRTAAQGGKTGGSWVEFEDLMNTGDIHLVEGNEYDTAEITHHYGPIRKPPDLLLDEFDPYDEKYEWTIVRITIDQVENEGQPDQRITNKPIFHGVIGSVEIDRENLIAVYKCFDLARWVMEHIRFDRGIAEREQFYAGEFVGLLGLKFQDNWVFNDKSSGADDDATLSASHIFEQGNMSEDLYNPKPFIAGSVGSPVKELNYSPTTDETKGINIFGWKGGESGVWTHRRILRYFVEAYINHGMIEDSTSENGFRSVLPVGFPLEFRVLHEDLLDSALIPTSDTDRAARASLSKKIAKLDLREKSIRECVHTVIRSAGNLGWRPIVLDNDDKDSGHVIGLLVWDKSAKPSGNAVENVALDSNDLATPISKVGMVVDVDSESVEYDPKPKVEIDATARANTIVVFGARREIGTTFGYWRRDSQGRPSLVGMWEDTAKTALDTLLASTAQVDKDKIEDRVYEAVYRVFGVPKRFNFEAMETLSGDEDYRPLCAKRVAVYNADTQKYEEVVQRDMFTGREIPVRILNHPRRFSPKLFLRNGWRYGDGAGGQQMPPTPMTFSDGQPKGQGEMMPPLYWLGNVDESLNFLRDFSGMPPAWAVKGFNERNDALLIEIKHRWFNLSESRKSACVDLTGRAVEIQKPTYGKGTRDLAPYDVDTDGNIDDTKLRDQNYEAWQAIIASLCLEVDDRPMLIIQDKESIARGDPVSMIALRSEEWKFQEAREMLVGFEDDGTPIVLGTDPDNPYIIRDDFPKLEAYARSVWAKSRKARRIGTLTYDFLDFTFEPCGMWVGKVRRKGESYVTIRVDAPVASVTHNLSAQTTVVATEEAVDAEPALMAYRVEKFTVPPGVSG